jgi:Tol biopolymer transport system component/DNA-binding winged helix-turn-helix (wHTH) protein
MRTPEANRVHFGPFVVDLHTHEVRKDGTRIRLIGQPFDILSVLLSKPGELVTREELRMRLWPGDTFVDFDHGLNAAVNKLRETLCDSADNPRFVETLPRRGYRFIAKIERLGVPEELAVPPSPSQPKPSPSQPKTDLWANITSGPQHTRSNNALSADLVRNPWVAQRLRLWLSPIAIAAALLLVFSFINTRNKGPRQALANSPAPAMRILAFTGPGEDAWQPAFSPDGKRIAFARWGANAEDSGIFVKQIGADNQTQITKNGQDRSPSWSPDGNTVAFARWQDPSFALFTVPASGGTEQKLDTRGVNSKRGELDWSPDGQWIAFNGGSALYLLSPRGESVRPLSNPPPSAEDRAPAFSADSKHVLFVRSRSGGIPEEIRIVNVDDGEETLVTAVTAEIIGAPRWSADGNSVLFSSNFGGKSGLWRVSADKRDSPIQISDSAAHPAIARQANLLAYERGSRGLNIWQLDLTASGTASRKREQTILLPQTGQTDQGPAPQISPDGKKLAFMSDRSGTMEIWVADADGKNAKQLTAIGNAGTPRWSPDGKAIVFDASRKNGSSIYAVSLEGDELRLVTPDAFENRCPSWSRDGKWIYFASRRTGRYEVWKTPATGGTPVQITRSGGHAALEAPDGKHIFYAKTALAYPEIWQADVNGGGEKLLSRDVRPPMWATWAVVDTGAGGGIVFAQPSGSGSPVVSLFDLATRRVKTVGQLGIIPFWLGASRDGKRVVFDQPGWQQSQIMLVENFR